jgi:O-antigen ligase
MRIFFPKIEAHQLQVRLSEYGNICIALLIVAIYFSTSMTTILSVVLGLLWVFSAQFMELPGILKKNSVAVWSLLLFSCFIIGLCYGSASYGESISMLSKYRKLIFIPVLCSFLMTERYRSWAWLAFVIASFLSLLISYLMVIGLLDYNVLSGPSFKSRITHSILTSFFAFFCAHKVYDGKRYAKLYLVLFMLCVYNLFFIVEGRTGQLIAVSLVLLFGVQRFTMRVLLLTVPVMAILLALYLNYSDKAARINEGVVNIQSDLHPDAKQTPSSMGQRYMFWKYSLKLIAEKPLFGHGTGSFAKEYQRVASNELMLSKNPHNEFIMISVQFGLLGLLIYIGFLASQYYQSRKLPDKEKWLAQGLMLSLIVTSLFNTPIMDYTEGHWFAVMIALCFASLQADATVEKNNA